MVQQSFIELAGKLLSKLSQNKTLEPKTHKLPVISCCDGRQQTKNKQDKLTYL